MRPPATALKKLAAVARAQGDAEQARAHYAESLSLYEMLGDRRGIAECRECLEDSGGPLDGEAEENYARAQSTQGGSGVIS